MFIYGLRCNLGGCSEAEVGVCGAEDTRRGGGRAGGAACELSPDRTPTNEAPSMPLQSGTLDANRIST